MKNGKILKWFKIPIKTDINTNGSNTVKKNVDPFLFCKSPKTNFIPALLILIKPSKNDPSVVNIVKPIVVFIMNNTSMTWIIIIISGFLKSIALLLKLNRKAINSANKIPVIVKRMDM